MGRWINHTQTLNIFDHDAPEICAEYRQKHNLLDEAGWKQLRHITKSKRNFSV